MNRHYRFPVIENAFDRSLRACKPEYQARHQRAWREPGDAHEAALGDMLRALSGYADAHEARYDSKVCDDGVLGPAWTDMLRGFRALLNGELGRFDGGALDAAACDLFLHAGGEGEL